MKKESHLDTTNPLNGEFLILNHDAEIFGFPVAEWILPQDKNFVLESKPFLLQKAQESKVRLVSCRVSATDYDLLSAAQQIGFKVVDCVVSLTSKHHRKIPSQGSPLPLRLAKAKDFAELEQIALDAFTTGRYFADPMFPKELAQKRYAMWVKNALAGRIPGCIVLVMEYEGQIAGFLVEKVEDDHSQGQLACINPKFKNGIFMYSLLIAHGAWMRENGIRKATTGRISIGLMQVINLNLAIQSTLGQPDYVLHWHSPQFPLK